MHRIGGIAVALVVLAAACAGSDGDAPSAAADDVAVTLRAQGDGCTWPMAGQNLARTHASACAAQDAVGAGTLDRLRPVWFAETRAEVTGAPAVTDDSLYLGDWSGRVYALDRASGETRWTRDLPVHPAVYAGQIPASPTVTDLGGRTVVVVAAGRTVHVLDAGDGAPVWSSGLGDLDDPEDPTEIQGSPAVVTGSDPDGSDGLVVVPTDVHNDRGRRSGVVALSLADGSVRWRWDPEAGRPSGGCGSVWGTPSVDVDRRLVVVGTGSCFSPDSWGPYSEAIVGLDLDTGRPRWSFQPRDEPNQRDWDFAGAANLFEIEGRAVAGLGAKDGTFYVVDRETGELVWSTEVQQQGEGSYFGGFIGATSVAADRRGRVVVAGGTAIGDCPCQVGLDAGSGAQRWASEAPTGTYGASAAAGGVVFTAGVDQTLRAYDLATGEVAWEEPLRAISASGPAIAGDFLAIGVGFREPGGEAPSGGPGGGVHAFRVLTPGEEAPTSTTAEVPAGPAVTALAPSDAPCVGAPCDVGFTLKSPPEGRNPTMTLEITPNPLRIRVVTSDLGPPEGWLRAGSVAARDGAGVYAVFITPRDDRPELGSVVCVLDASGACIGEEIALPAPAYTRISLLALVDENTPPTLQEGYDRLVTTRSFDPPLTPAG